jgi:hypothetical protein
MTGIIVTHPVRPHAGLENAIKDAGAEDVRSIIDRDADDRPTTDQIQDALKLVVRLEKVDTAIVLGQHGARLYPDQFCTLTRRQDPISLLEAFRDTHTGDWQEHLNEIMSCYPTM